VDAEVVSPFPPLLNYLLPAAHGRDLARWVNEYIAGLCAAAPGRIYGLGTVPLQDPDLAAAELGSAVGELGLAGVEIASNIGGVSLADERFLGFFAEAERLGAAVFVHAMPVPSDRLPPPATATFGVGAEGSLAAAALITGGVAERYPGLRLAFSRGGRIPADAAESPVVLGPDLERGTARRAWAGGRALGRRDRAGRAGPAVLLRQPGVRPAGHQVPHRHARRGPAPGGVRLPGHAEGIAGGADAAVDGPARRRARRHHVAQLLPLPRH
jgi:hypothetical protein